MSFFINSIGNWFNAIIDALIIISERFFSLPLVILLVVSVIISIVFYTIVRSCNAKKERLLSEKYGLILLTLLVFSLFFDIKVSRVRKEYFNTAQANNSYHSSLFDVARLRGGLRDIFGEFSLSVESQQPGIDYALIQISNPHEVKVHVAVIDLGTPGLEISITPKLSKKGLTSEFARINNCVVAINGEAGGSPFFDESLSYGKARKVADFDPGLGIWSGVWIVKGKSVMSENKDKRPFISFDKDNRPSYFKSEVRDVSLTPDKYNTIWGRFDAIVYGRVTSTINDMLQPRTCMGINKDATRLILLVADGRRPGHSMGLDPSLTVKLLQLFGAWNAMFCDQGGSSCMYLRSKGGIVNIPSDGEGIERPVYCSFGVSVISP